MKNIYTACMIAILFLYNTVAYAAGEVSATIYPDLRSNIIKSLNTPILEVVNIPVRFNRVISTLDPTITPLEIVNFEVEKNVFTRSETLLFPMGTKGFAIIFKYRGKSFPNRPGKIAFAGANIAFFVPDKPITKTEDAKPINTVKEDFQSGLFTDADLFADGYAKYVITSNSQDDAILERGSPIISITKKRPFKSFIKIIFFPLFLPTVYLTTGNPAMVFPNRTYSLRVKIQNMGYERESGDIRMLLEKMEEKMKEGSYNLYLLLK